MKMTKILGAPARHGVRGVCTALVLAGLLSACGQRGPLYLPAPAPATATEAAQERPPRTMDDTPLSTGTNTNTPVNE
jgi:predicted small lipoprotein YifL